jgi:hypothetical protein
MELLRGFEGRLHHAYQYIVLLSMALSGDICSPSIGIAVTPPFVVLH